MLTARIAAMSVLICAGCDGPDHANNSAGNTYVCRRIIGQADL